MRQVCGDAWEHDTVLLQDAVDCALRRMDATLNEQSLGLLGRFFQLLHWCVFLCHRLVRWGDVGLAVRLCGVEMHAADITEESGRHLVSIIDALLPLLRRLYVAGGIC